MKNRTGVLDYDGKEKCKYLEIIAEGSCRYDVCTVDHWCDYHNRMSGILPVRPVGHIGQPDEGYVLVQRSDADHRLDALLHRYPVKDF